MTQSAATIHQLGSLASVVADDADPVVALELRTQSKLWSRLGKVHDPRQAAESQCPPTASLDDYVRGIAALIASADVTQSAMAETCSRRLALLRSLALPPSHVFPAALACSEVTPSGRDGALIGFSVPTDLLPLFTGRAGQHVTLHLEVEGVPLRRSYSLVTSPARVAAESRIMIGVRSQPKGRVSPALVDRLAVDTVVAISPPGGSMTLPADEQRGSVLLLGAGSGVTPLLALAEEALEGHSEAEVTLVLVERTRADVLGQEIVDGLARTYPDRFRFDVLCTRPGGHPDARRVSEAVQRLVGSRANLFASAFICGPEGFSAEAAACAVHLGIPEAATRHESFTINGRRLQPRRPGGVVTVEVGDRERLLEVRPGESILGAGLREGADLPYSCLSGSCGTCAIRVVSGAVAPWSPDVLGEGRTAEGWVLACQAAPQ